MTKSTQQQSDQKVDRPFHQASEQELQAVKLASSPLNSAINHNDVSDLDALDSIVKDAVIVGLGEITHGISECFTLKNRFIKYLVEHKGFTVFSIEANMPEAYKINEYVLHGIGNPFDLLNQMKYWIWNTKEVYDLIQWMREYNKTADKKVQFTGFDMQIPDRSVDILQQQISNLSLKEDLRTILKILNLNLWRNTPDILIQDLKEYKEITALFARLESYLHANHSSNLWLLQNLKILQQIHQMNCCGNNRGAEVYARDLAMAENVKWIRKQNPAEKMILWGHNTHVTKQDFRLGEHLMRELLSKYCAIGFVAHHGTYMANSFEDGKLKLKTDLHLHPAPEGTLEGTLQKLNQPLLLVDFKKTNNSSLLFAMPVCRLGVGGLAESKILEENFGPYDIKKGFDGLVYIENSHASKPILYSYVTEQGMFNQSSTREHLTEIKVSTNTEQNNQKKSLKE